MNRFLAFLVVITFLYSCESTDYKGFRRLHDTVHYKRITLGDDTRKVVEDAFISFSISVVTYQDSLLLEKRVKRVQFAGAKWPEDIKKLIATANEGEELEIIGSVGDMGVKEWFSPVDLGSDTARLKMHVTINEVIDAKTLLQLRADERLRADFEMKGQLEFQNALDSLNFKDADLVDGIYFKALREGKGAAVQPGGIAKIHYKTYLANGKRVDDTYNDEPFEYHVGKPDQVLKGFAQAISMMREGGKAQFIIPYHLAYGEKGSSSGIVPPYSAIIYEAELTKVLN